MILLFFLPHPNSCAAQCGKREVEGEPPISTSTSTTTTTTTTTTMTTTTTTTPAAAATTNTRHTFGI